MDKNNGKKQERYSKEQLFQARKDSDAKIVGELVGKLLKREKLSIAETNSMIRSASISEVGL